MTTRPLFLFAALVATGCGGSDAADQAAADSTGAAALPPGAAPPPVIGGDTLINLVTLRCGDGRAVSASYFTGTPPVVSLNFGDSAIRVPQAIAASGARYANADESLVWWNKGDTTTLTWQGRSTQCVQDATVEF